MIDQNLKNYMKRLKAVYIEVTQLPFQRLVFYVLKIAPKLIHMIILHSLSLKPFPFVEVVIYTFTRVLKDNK